MNWVLLCEEVWRSGCTGSNTNTLTLDVSESLASRSDSLVPGK